MGHQVWPANEEKENTFQCTATPCSFQCTHTVLSHDTHSKNVSPGNPRHAPNLFWMVMAPGAAGVALTLTTAAPVTLEAPIARQSASSARLFIFYRCELKGRKRVEYADEVDLCLEESSCVR